jgi:lipopolysaccharide export system ATP-binding protein
MKLRSQNLVKQYGAKRVVNDVSVEVNQGEIVGLLGPNGAGKTTSFYMFVGLVRPDEGQVFLEDTEISSWPMFKRAQHGFGFNNPGQPQPFFPLRNCLHLGPLLAASAILFCP